MIFANRLFSEVCHSPKQAFCKPFLIRDLP
jgi:hypothetical protein